MKIKDDVTFSVDNKTEQALKGHGWVIAVDDEHKRVQVASNLGMVIWMDQANVAVVASFDAGSAAIA